ncbi:MAG TPA: hypothetical protein VIC35_01465 [Acidimicrobiia bacterium]
MGSKGRKPRKPSHSQHLPKVGTAAENTRLQHEERSAVADVMGLGNASSATKAAVMIIGGIIFALAILAFVLVLST